MRISSIYPILGAALLAYSQISVAENASVKITSPADGTKLDATAQSKLVYEVIPGPKGDHSHLYVDDKEAAILRQLKGSYELATLSPGQHNICIKIVNKGHTPIGVEQCVKVTVN
ncbi:hypothetical protein D3878_04860 [Noviherbaspirillum sedimenti]|uniref:DUF4399 domain-containing protein n=2 Tax=Noviherbaspirillum sedimenti TaxID=2320865 RepID=A0A3A3GPH1_9BURK|nr:hypothetical protein D3878_04860 [Noviherbaspirillum sedimenti]